MLVTSPVTRLFIAPPATVTDETIDQMASDESRPPLTKPALRSTFLFPVLKARLLECVAIENIASINDHPAADSSQRRGPILRNSSHSVTSTNAYSPHESQIRRTDLQIRRVRPQAPLQLIVDSSPVHPYRRDARRSRGRRVTQVVRFRFECQAKQSDGL
jgi:hypothetical protein